MQPPLAASCWRVFTGLHLPYGKVDGEHLSGFIYIGKFVTRQTKYACHNKNQLICRRPETHGNSLETLGKEFVVGLLCLANSNRQIRISAECYMSGTRQTVCREFCWHYDKYLRANGRR
jgi:hypothetical protein